MWFVMCNVYHKNNPFLAFVQLCSHAPNTDKSWEKFKVDLQNVCEESRPSNTNL